MAGEVSLLLAASPALIGQVDTVEALIEKTALPLTTAEGCGGDSNSEVPNHTYGYGRIDAWSAFTALRHTLSLTKTAAAAAISPGELLTYTLTVDNEHFLQPATNVVLTDVLPSGTAFITATQPFNLSERTVRWYTPTLAANSSWQVELVVQVTVSPTGTIPRNTPTGQRGVDVFSGRKTAMAQPKTITNEYYGVRSDETTSNGQPVITRLLADLPFSVLLPIIR